MIWEIKVGDENRTKARPIKELLDPRQRVDLASRSQTEERLIRRLTETRLSLIEYAADHTLDELLTRALDEVGVIVDSPIGFCHFVEPDQKSLSLQQWSTRTMEEFCQAEGKGMQYGIDQAGVWVDCVHERKPVVHNDYASLPHKKGMPEGHAEVIRELVVPVMREGKVAAILGVGNKPTEYTDRDVEIVAYLADVIWEVARQKRAEERIRQERETLALISNLNQAANRGDSLHEVIELFDRQARNVFSVDDATIYLLSQDKEHLILQNLTLPRNLARRIEKLIGRDIPRVRIHLGAGSVYAEILQAGKPRIIDDPAMIQQMMAECTESKVLRKLVPAISRILNYRSVMSVPLVVDGEVIGLVDMSRQELFSQSDLERFVVVAERFTAILRRKRAEEALHRSLEQTAHNQRLLLALSQAAQAVQRARSPEAVYLAIGEQAAGLGFDITVFTLSEDQKHLGVSHLTLRSDLVRTAEKLTGLSAGGYRFPLTPDGYFQRIIARGETVLSHLDAAPIAEALPQPVRPLAGRLAGLFGWKQSIIAPLTIGGEVQGLLVVTGADLTESDVPAVTAFANQAAIAMENARLYKETQRLAAFNESIVQSMAEGIAVEDADGVFTFVNPAAATLLGYAPDELVGLHWTTIIPPDQQPIVRAADERRMLGEADSYELGMVRKDGGRISVLVGSTPRFDTEGRFTGTMAVFTDITDRKRAEEALRGSEQQYRALVEQSLQGIVVIQDFRIVFANVAFAQLAGFDVEEILSLSPEEVRALVHPEDQALVWTRFRDRLMGKPVSPRYEYRGMRKDGTVRWLEMYAGRIEYDGKPAIQAIIVDITERVRAEEESERLTAQIREQARQMEQILATVPAGVLLLDAEGRVLQANPVAEKDLADLAGAKVGDVLVQLGDRPLADLLTSPPTKGLWHEVRADKRIFEIIGRPIDNGPEPEYWVLVVNNVTQEREIREQLQQQERMAAVGQLAAGIAHDFNNIMTSILLSAQVTARSGGVSEQARERMAVINQQCWHATRLIQQILDFGRRAVLERRSLDLLPLLKEQVKLLERTLPEHIEIELDYGEDEYTVHADPTRMQQMVTNLAVNARDAMPDGGTLRIGLERITVERGRSPLVPEMEAGEWIRLAVSDTGTGIAPDVLPHIFEPFFTTKGPGEGSGLGLAQVYGIVGQHGGRIDVETQMGEGTTSTIYLPALEVRPSERPLPDVFSAPQGEGEVVLVAEDEDTVRAVLVESLEHLNYQVLEAANGHEALALMEEWGEQIALVLSDMVMPVMGGVALFHALQQRGLTLPVVMLSGHPLEKELNRLQAQGLAGWMLKPPNIEQLAQLLAQVLGKDSIV